MYSKITNPITGRKVSINGKLGKKGRAVVDN